MLDVERRVVVGLEEPGIEVLIDEDIHADDMEALPVHFGEGGAIVVFKKWIDSREEALGELFDSSSQQSHVHPILNQLLPNNLQTALPALAKSILAIHEVRVILVEAVVREMDVWIAEVFLAGLLVVLSAESGQSFFIEVADVRIK